MCPHTHIQYIRSLYTQNAAMCVLVKWGVSCIYSTYLISRIPHHNFFSLPPFPLSVHSQVTNFTSSFSDGRMMCCLVHHYHPSLLPLEKIRHETTNTQSAEHLRKEEMEAKGTDNWEEELQGQWTTSFSPSQCLLLLPILLCSCCLWENGSGNGQLIVATIDQLFSVSSLQTVPDRRSTTLYLLSVISIEGLVVRLLSAFCYICLAMACSLHCSHWCGQTHAASPWQ